MTPCGAVRQCMVSPQSYASQAPGATYRTPSTKSVAAFALQKLEAARQKDIATHTANEPILAANREARARIQALMDELGVPLTFREPVASRSRFPKHATRDAGYIGDMRRNFPVDDSFADATASYERLLATYKAYEASATVEDEKAKAAAEAAEERRKAERRANIELARIVLRYGLDQDSEWSDVLEALRKRDQRLDLAVAMAQTRGDWSEGPYRVNAALDRFKIETEEDKAIANDVVSCLHDFDDGRVFRDTTWSYGALFASAADQQLSADVQAAMNRGEQ